jgi:hypothetical protein
VQVTTPAPLEEAEREKGSEAWEKGKEKEKGKERCVGGDVM